MNITSKKLAYLSKLVSDKHMEGTKQELCRKLNGTSFGGYTERFVNEMIGAGCIAINDGESTEEKIIYKVDKIATLKVFVKSEDFDNLEKILLEMGVLFWDPRLYEPVDSLKSFIKRHF